MHISWITMLLLCAWAGTVAAASVTLPEAVRAAVARRPLAEAARWRAEAAAAAADETASRSWPRLIASESYTRTDEPGGSMFIALNQERNVMTDPGYDLIDPDAQSDFETRLSLELPLFEPDLYYGRRRARVGAEAAAAASGWSREEAAMAALQAYLEVQRAQAAAVTVESSRQEAAELARLASERQAAGTGLKADALRARVFLSESERRALTVRNDLVVAQRRLALAMGDGRGEISIAAPLGADALPVAGDAGIDGRADLAAIEQAALAAQLGERQARAAWLPRADAQASYALHDESTPFGSDGADWMVRGNLSWELFDGFRRSAGSARSSAEHQALQAERSEARNRSRFQLEEARLRQVEADTQLELARQALVAAEEGTRLLRQRYEAGLVDLADLLAAQSALDRTRFEIAGAETQVLQARANVHFQQGRLLAVLLPQEEKIP